ncbi:hypothetical protein DPMN_003275 [Dreissena polymorpha]|uniref:Uncharacterized protein n=1 Tax=Dreissena polymorpha TaxID=45954 RepID=A0A9D4RUM5_DREPO|nr:hypothetical protein DPMN_003275 [Dreissena polymorpha]
MFCPDHNHLCCSKCVELNHRLCQVTPLPQAARGKLTNFKNLSVRTENTLSQMKQCQTYQEDRMKSLKVSYKEHERLIVDGLRVNIVSYLRECETSTVNTTHEYMQYPIEMREKIKYLLADFEKSTIKEKKEELNLKQAPLKVVRNSCIRLHYELFHLHVAIPKLLGKPELSLIASTKCLEKKQQSNIFLKENFPNHVFTVNGKSLHNVKMPSDIYMCQIRAVCALPNGQVLVADYSNKIVKLLSQQYQMVSHWDFRDALIQDMCLITPTEVAVAVYDGVQFITVSQSQLAKGRKLKLQPYCTGIAHNQGDLYICSYTALYKFTLSGELVCRLYDDSSADLTVIRCAVSPTGDRLYITSYWNNKLLTLARDGTLLATYTDPALRGLYGLHVTPAGQVLVCGYGPHTILQVGWEGQSKLANLATQKDGVLGPESVCYSSTTSSIIVGQWGDNIRVFRVE